MEGKKTRCLSSLSIQIAGSLHVPCRFLAQKIWNLSESLLVGRIRLIGLDALPDAGITWSWGLNKITILSIPISLFGESRERVIV